jgi:hypothetical protein
MEFLVTYGWAVLIIAVAISVVYIYFSFPQNAAPPTCSFTDGVMCNDFILGSNLSTHATQIEMFIVNSQPYPIKYPEIYAGVSNLNSTIYSCYPNFVLPGGSILCNAKLPVNTSLGQFISGTLYFNATSCTSPNDKTIAMCTGGSNQTYIGNFAGKTQQFTPFSITINLMAVNSTQTPNNQKDMLLADVEISGQPFTGATVNFTQNDSSYTLHPNITITNQSGIAVSYVWGDVAGNDTINASYGNVVISNNVIVQFCEPSDCIHLRLP